MIGCCGDGVVPAVATIEAADILLEQLQSQEIAAEDELAAGGGGLHLEVGVAERRPGRSGGCRSEDRVL